MSRPHSLLALCLALLGAMAPAAPSHTRATRSPATVSRVVANDNRKPAGTLAQPGLPSGSRRQR